MGSLFISGFTVARNVIRLGYPASQSIRSARPICDEYILSYDPWSDDGTEEWARQIGQELDLKLVENKWEVMENGQMWYDKKRDINEIARQTAFAASQCSHEWNLYVQLDEGFHEDHHADIRDAILNLPPSHTGLDFYRLAFYKNLHTIRADWTTFCTRAVRKGTHNYLVPGGGMSAQALVGEHAQLLSSKKTGERDKVFWLYHYVRMGEPETIARRVRNLDTFYHDPSTLIPEDQLQPYDFKPREFDNTSLVEAERPRQVAEDLRVYQGTHPFPFAEFYQEYN